MTAVLIAGAAYLLGAVPTAYIVARYVGGLDIRRYGSGNVGASNLSELYGWWAGVALGVFDAVVKGTLVVVAARLLDQSVAVQALAGVAAVAGHCWSVYIGFTGGRGVATALGAILGLLMWKELLVMAAIIGVFSRLVVRESAFAFFIAMLALPLLAAIFQEPVELAYMSVVLVSVLFLKRLTANWERPAAGRSLARVLMLRLTMDRDVPAGELWTRRKTEPS